MGRDPVADVEGFFFFLNNRAICHTLYIFAVFAGDIKTDFYGTFFFLPEECSVAGAMKRIRHSRLQDPLYSVSAFRSWGVRWWGGWC